MTDSLADSSLLLKSLFIVVFLTFIN